MGHRYIASGLFSPTCGSCGQGYMAPAHIEDLADDLGADVIECPGCQLPFSIEQTVRMLTFRGERGRFRVCHFCAGLTPANPYLGLALQLKRGLITEDQYLDALEKLASA